MLEPILTYEVKQLLTKIKTDIVKIYPIQVISLNYFLYAVMDSKTNSVKIWLDDNTPKEFINALNMLISDRITKDTMYSVMQNEASVKFSEDYDEIVNSIYTVSKTPITSEGMFLTIISNDLEYTRLLMDYGLSVDYIINGLSNKNSEKTEQQNIHKRKSKIKRKKEANELYEAKMPPHEGLNRLIPDENNIVEVNCTNLVRLASKGEYDNVIGMDDLVDAVFDIVSKCDRKCVAIVGERGVGKTSLIGRIAKRLYEQDCPKTLKDKYLMRFEEQISNIITDEMEKYNKYIGVIDGLEKLFVTKETEAPTVFMLKQIMSLKNTPIIVTMDEASYAKNIESKPDLSRYLEKITIEAPKGDELYDIVKSGSIKYGAFHNVSYDDESIDTAIRLAKRYISIDKLPMSALNVLDSAGAYSRLRVTEPEDLIAMKTKLYETIKRKNEISNNDNPDAYDERDSLTRTEIDLKNSIKTYESNEETVEITESDIKNVISRMVNIPISDMDDDDKSKLRNLKSNLSKVVIGQDSTIDDVCRAVRRQRVGLSNPNKPCVMLFCGSTGVGKVFSQAFGI